MEGICDQGEADQQEKRQRLSRSSPPELGQTMPKGISGVEKPLPYSVFHDSVQPPLAMDQ